jgi:hypothetical protein
MRQLYIANTRQLHEAYVLSSLPGALASILNCSSFMPIIIVLDGEDHEFPIESEGAELVF